MVQLATAYSRAVPKLSRLKAIREKQLLTQRELAEKAQVSPTTIVRLEREQVEAEFRTIRKLAQALGVKPQDLL